jgi:hypothetical protein
MSQLSLSDSVWQRVVQIIQESLLLGIDCVDLLRMIRVCPDEQNVNQLVLTPEYEKQVASMHDAWLEKAEKLQLEQQEGESVEEKKSPILFN